MTPRTSAPGEPKEPTGAVPRERAPLTRDLVVDTAIAQIDSGGLGALTMRRLGEQLGVEAMSIYHHVNGREDLLEAVVDRLVEDARVDPEVALGPADGWQAYLVALAHSMRNVAVSHPQVFPLMATRPPAAPWLRPPLRSLRVVEDFLTAMTSRGMGDDAAVSTYKVFTSFLLGHLLLEVSQQGAETGPADEPLDEGEAEMPNDDQQLSLEPYPEMRRLSGRLRTSDPDTEFVVAIEAMLERLDSELSQ